MDFCLTFVISNDGQVSNAIDLYEIVEPPKNKHEIHRVFGLRFRLVLLFFRHIEEDMVGRRGH